MLIVVLILGLIAGSFVNALIWRLHEQEQASNKHNKSDATSLKKAQNTSHKSQIDLSITKGRSICPNCYQQLKASDLIPVISWLLLKGKCRYCHKPISVQYPLVELATGVLFALSCMLWTEVITDWQTALFGLWLAILTLFIALSVYDIKWFLLPNRMVYPLGGLAIAYSLVGLIISDNQASYLLNLFFAALIGGGIFYLIYQISKGKWIGGGDVRLGWILGLLAATPARSLLFIFIASLLGTIISFALIAAKNFKRDHLIPFGPFLIAGLIIVQFYGTRIIDWYTSKIFIL